MHPVTKQHVIYAMDKNANPSTTVDNGAVYTVETLGILENQINPEDQPLQSTSSDKPNYATGPIFINEATPGDILAVTIEKIQLIDETVTLTSSNLDTLNSGKQENTMHQFPITNNKLIFSEEISIPLKKMIGIIGTAPSGEPVSFDAPSTHGGAMECKEIEEGVTLFLPVNVPGALLALGNIHISLASSEAPVSSAAIKSEVTMRLQVVKNKKWSTPSLINQEKIMTIASATSLDEARIIATRNMVQLLKTTTNATSTKAIMLLSLAGDLKISQTTNPNKTVYLELPLQYWSENPFL